MSEDASALEGFLQSGNLRARLRATKLLLRHPDASPLQIVRCLCSEDLRGAERVFDPDLNDTIRLAGHRLHGVDDERVYEYLLSLWRTSPLIRQALVEHVLQLIQTARSAEVLAMIGPGGRLTGS